MTGQYRAEVLQLNGGRVLRFRLLRDDVPLAWTNVVSGWQSDSLFREFFISLLIDAPFRAYFWETPPITNARINTEFEFVLVDSPRLADIHTEQMAFENQFAVAPVDEAVIEFANLSGDANLVVPCLRGAQSAYSQIATFARLGPENQQHELWKMVGITLERLLGTQPLWLSTSGLGVYWVHIRFDAVPKYYTHDPYRYC